MNRNTTLIALALAAASTGAFADDITIDTTPFVSTKSRAQVMQELAQYQQAGVNPHATSYNPLKYFRSTKSREQVAQEFAASREEVRAMTAEDSGSAWIAAHRAQPAGSQLAKH